MRRQLRRLLQKGFWLTVTSPGEYQYQAAVSTGAAGSSDADGQKKMALASDPLALPGTPACVAAAQGHASAAAAAAAPQRHPPAGQAAAAAPPGAAPETWG